MANKIIYRTVRDAYAAGYWETGSITRERGYISRRSNLEELPVYMASGKRRGELYYLAPSFASSRYCYRIYLERSI